MNQQHEYQIRNGQLKFEDGTTLTVISCLAEQDCGSNYYHRPEQRPRDKASRKGSPSARHRFLFAAV